MRFMILVLVVCFTAAASSNAQTIFMKIKGIDGDATEKRFEKQFKILAFEQAGENNTTLSSGTGSSGTGKVSYNKVQVKKLLYPAANPAIMSRLSKGTQVDTVLFSWTRQSGDGLQTYYQIKLSNVLISYVAILSPECITGNCQNLFEEIHFTYGRTEWIGYTQDNNGVIKVADTRYWDILTNTGN